MFGIFLDWVAIVVVVVLVVAFGACPMEISLRELSGVPVEMR